MAVLSYLYSPIVTLKILVVLEAFFGFVLLIYFEI